MLRRSNIFVEKMNNIEKELPRSFFVLRVKISIMVESEHPKKYYTILSLNFSTNKNAP
ncbi:hypothetical protein SAMN05421847_2086 [Halpernia humi]|uniref:Uncharacterized protein n=1 Tax=Halpernia humi TaxID=493375 RepID=A0A1H5ZKZ2_9FLAO|nr:hypothetical protein SAMN05421847_2086 [Halpernia humi]